MIRKDFSGIVEAVEYVKLAFRVSGQIINLPVIEGEKVKKGQLIASIDPRDIALQYAATKSAYETASAQVERNKRLLSRQAISVQEYEISLSNYQKAKSEYELSTNNMRDTKLTAPFDGSIEKRLVENYQRVNSGEGIVQLVNTQHLRLIPARVMCARRDWRNIWTYQPKELVFRLALLLTIPLSTGICMP